MGSQAMASVLARSDVAPWLLLVSRTCGLGLSLAIPTITLYWSENGVSIEQGYLLQIIFAAALLLLEVATGRFADRFGRAFTLKLASCAGLIACVIYTCASSFQEFLAGELLFALSLSLASGADEAYLFQVLRQANREGEQNRWMALMQSAGFWFMAGACVVGSYLAEIDLRLPYYFACGLQVVSLLTSLALVEPGGKEIVAVRRRETEEVRRSVNTVLFSGQRIRWIVFAPAWIGAVTQTFLWSYPTLLGESGFALGEFGWAFALFNIVAAGSAMLVRGVTGLPAQVRILFLLYLAVAVTAAMIGTMNGAWIWLLILPQQCVRSVSGSLFSKELNRAIPEEIRATTLSVRNALKTLAYILAMTPWWLLVKDAGLQNMCLLNASLLVIGGFFFLFGTPAEKEE